METNRIKSFAKGARLILMDGVLQRLKYWGFNIDGSIDQNLQSTKGGYIFRGQVFTDSSIPGKWNKLKKNISNKQDVKDVVELAAYTWFNRLMAIKILEVNGYIPPVLEFTQDIRTPVLVQDAKRGQHILTKQSDKDLLIEYLQEDKEEQALGLLVTELCNTNKLLHDVFGRIDDYTEILLPQNLLQKDGILELINSSTISEEDYKEVELIGWLYQFYISDKKDEVFAGFKKNQKARAEDIPAATQIFTPKWIVKYMVENTVGKIYLNYYPGSSIKAELKFLVGNDTDKDNPPIISDIKELTLFDPACGSGHILVTGFELLVKMYREEGYTAKQSVESILQHNIFGLDIDDRAMQLSRFAVLLKAAEFDRDILKHGIIPKIYSFPESTLTESFKEEYFSKEQSDWHQLLGMKLKKEVSLSWSEMIRDKNTGREKEIQRTLVYSEGTSLNNSIIENLNSYYEDAILVDCSNELEKFWGEHRKDYAYSEFFYAIMILQEGKNNGSATKLKLSKEAINHIRLKYDSWNEKAIKLELNAFDQIFWDTLKPYLDILFLLENHYTAVVANPPYLKQQNMNPGLKEYVNSVYPKSKSDLFAVFMEICLRLVGENGIMGMINQHSWMFLTSFEELRNFILEKYSIESMLHLGPRTFEELSGEVVQSTAFILNTRKIRVGNYHRLVQYRDNESKENAFFEKRHFYINVPHSNFDKIPGKRIGYWFSDLFLSVFKNNALGEIYEPKSGVLTGKDPLFVRNWYESSFKKIGFGILDHNEMLEKNYKWIPITNGGAFRKWYGNLYNIVNLENNGYTITNLTNNNHRLRNPKYYFKHGINWTLFMSGKFCVRESPEGILFGNGSRTFFPSDKDYKYLCCLFNSTVARQILELYNPTTNFVNEDISSVPIVYIEKTDEIDSIFDAVYFISKDDWNSRETSWDFEQTPLLKKGNSLKEAFHHWQEQVTHSFFQLHSSEEELNRIFIDIYGLQKELNPEVSLTDITILQDEMDRNKLEILEPLFRENGKDAINLPINRSEVISQFVSFAFGIFLGRYRLGKPGINISHQNPTEEEISHYLYNGQKIVIDEDGIIPIMGENCAFPDDSLVRVKDLILTIWGEETLTNNLNFLQECLGMSLHKWLNEKFWIYHTSMYKKKPIYWMFSSNAKKPQNAAFKVLVYMHRMDKYTVQKIQRNYLHPQQEYIKREIEKLLESEEILSKQEQKHLEQLQNWELECRDYNEVLKEFANQQLEFDLDDGVDVNYAKFEGAVAII